MAVTAALAAAAVRAEALTLRAGAVAFAFGSVIVVVAGYPFLALLVLFVVASVLVTRYRIDEKSARHVQEGRHGERGVSNVVAHILVPTALALAALALPARMPDRTVALLYTAALAFGAADTFASELGVLSGRAVSILHGRSVTPGTNGGVSPAGEAWAFVGAGLTAVVGAGLFTVFGQATGSLAVFVGGAAVAGFAGCQIDSVLGELLENRGYLSKGGTNLAAMAATVLLAAGLLLALGGGWP